MRLIDADNIYWEYKCIAKEEIDEQPTVEAIPIEWIEKYMNKFQLYGVCGDEYFILDNMLCAWEWEKENEQKK